MTGTEGPAWMIAAPTPREIASIACRRKWLLAGAAMLPVAAAITGLSLLPPRYAASASVMVKTGREYLAREEGQVTGQSAPQTTKQEAVNSEIEIMTSRGSIETVIEHIGLGRLYPTILRSPPTQGTPMDAAVEQFNRRLKVEAVKISNVIDLSFSHHDKALAARVLAEFLRVYNERHLAVFGGGTSSRVYAGAVASDIADLDRLEHERERLRLESGVFDADEQRMSLISQRADAEDELRQAVDRRATLQARIAFLAPALGRMPPVETSTETDKNDASQAPAIALIELERQRSDLLARFAPEHPMVKSIDAQIAAVEGTRGALSHPFVHVHTDRSPLGETVTQDLLMSRAELVPLSAQIDRDRSAVDGFTAELRRVEAADTALRTIGERIDSLTENLREERTQYEKARALDGMDALKALSVTTIQGPIAGGRPVFPNTLMFAAGGVVLGGLSASGLLILLVLLNDRIVGAETIERAFGLPVLGTIAERHATA